MKIIILSFFLLFVSCINSAPIDKNTLVQLCLDKMHQNKAYDYLESSRLILVKNENSININSLHFGKKNIHITIVPANEVKVYASAADVVNNERHLKVVQFDLNKSTAEITIRLMNVNQLITFYLAKNDGRWQVNSSKVSME